MGTAFTDPDNHERAARLAHAMYEHVCQAGLDGLPFADVAAAIAMVNGMFLAGAYDQRLHRKIAARTMANAAVWHAKNLEKLPRVPYGTTPAGHA